MLEIAPTPKTLGPLKSGALGLNLFNLMVNPSLNRLCILLNHLTP